MITARDDETGRERRIQVTARLDGPIEVDYYRQGGILPAVLRRLAGTPDGAKVSDRGATVRGARQ
jgi:aconitase A